MVQFPFLVGIQLVLGDIVNLLPTHTLIEADQRCKRGKNLGSVQLAHLGMLPTENISVMNWPVLKNDVPIAHNSCRNRICSRGSLRGRQTNHLQCPLSAMTSNLLAAFNGGRALQHILA